jgi:membrane fusion protein (multidrug efflux system)
VEPTYEKRSKAALKIGQRLPPLRITLDPRELAAHPLRVGLSMEVEVDLSDR